MTTVDLARTSPDTANRYDAGSQNSGSSAEPGSRTPVDAAAVSSNDLEVVTLRSAGELESVQATWEKWQTHPNSDFAPVNLVCGLRPNIESPLVMAVKRQRETVALLIARLERSSFAPRIGYFTPFRIPAKMLTVIYQGALGQIDREVATALVRHVWKLLAAGEADTAEFHHVPDDSPLLDALREHGSRRTPSWNTHWSMAIPDDAEFPTKKLRGKHRSWIRKKERELETAYPGQITWRWLAAFDDIPAVCRILEGVASRSYQRQVGGGFADDEEHRQRFELYARRGELRVQLLEIDGTVRAFWIGSVYKGVFHSAETAYEPSLRSFEVGTQVFIRMLSELSREGVAALDFGLGDAFYKQRFGDRRWEEGTVRLFAPRVKGMTLLAAGRSIGFLDEAGRSLVQKFGSLSRVKTLWRRRLTNTGTTKDPDSPSTTE
jgi:CelD/BcsL family acetyltransferase involved in cellulose biosynthesis